ncbi:MAG: putative metal-binding motif-containing protein [Myxococcota bacterium]
MHFARLALVVSLATIACNNPSNTDADRDGVMADVDCNDFDASAGAETLWFADADGDGWGDEAAGSTSACDRPAGYALRNGDCDDDAASVNPAAEEQCNGIDEDCDSFIDENTNKGVWYADVDGDGFGDPGTATETCDGTGGLVTNSLDCNDNVAEIKPGADEVCDDQDNDCDGRTDEADAVDASAWYLDGDGDGFGLNLTEVVACNAPSDSWANAGDDCSDDDPTVNPGADERCDGFDNNCDGSIDGEDATDARDWYPDDDGDTYGDPTSSFRACRQPDGFIDRGDDCNDRDRFINPDTPWYLDGDGDGYGTDTTTVASCLDPSSGSDTYVANLADCDDADSAVSPDAIEVCDGVDNNCDGSADGGDATDAITYFMDFDGDGFGSPDRTGKACSAPPGFTTDDQDCDDDNKLVNPDAVEFCDDLDNDCDTLIDYADPDVTSPTWYADADGDEYGDPDDSQVSCEQPEDYVLDDEDCDDDDKDVNPGAIEVCDAGLDNDCDGLIDTADPDNAGDGTWYRDADGDDFGDRDLTVTTCTEPSGYVRNDDDCDDSDLDKNHPSDCWSGPREFTTCNQTGPTGPSQNACDTAYSGESVDEEGVVVTGGIQKWVVPFDGMYEIEVFGAGGAKTNYSYYSTSDSKGARMRGTFELEEGDELFVAVGQKGTAGAYGGGGGGGSWVVDADDAPLVIAGGGGGIYYFSGYYRSGASGCGGTSGEYGLRGSTSSNVLKCTTKTGSLGEGGVNSATYNGAGGGGLNSSGRKDSYNAQGGSGYLDGLTGGEYSSGSVNAAGGFGGGGAAYFGGGGGGGYSGADSGYVGGGGGSYNDGTDASNTADTHTGQGKISIDLVIED